jgi:GNAT superfamily N-acetyltransferase
VPSDDLVIHVADTDDIAAVASLRLAWGDGAHEDEVPNFERHLAEWIAAEGERRTIWLAELAGWPVGMATLYEFRRMPRPGRMDSRWGYVGNMFVREDRRNRGIGSALIRAVIEAAQERRYVRVVLSPTRRSVPFYRRAGFVDADGEAGESCCCGPTGSPDTASNTCECIRNLAIRTRRVRRGNGNSSGQRRRLGRRRPHSPAAPG